MFLYLILLLFHIRSAFSKFIRFVFYETGQVAVKKALKLTIYILIYPLVWWPIKPRPGGPNKPRPGGPNRPRPGLLNKATSGVLFFSKVLVLALCYYLGLYSFYAMFCDLFGLEDPTLIFSDTLNESTDSTSLEEQHPFYQRKEFWIGVATVALVVGISIYYFVHTGGPKGDDGAVVYNSVEVQTDIPPAPLAQALDVPIITLQPYTSPLPSATSVGVQTVLPGIEGVTTLPHSNPTLVHLIASSIQDGTLPNSAHWMLEALNNPSSQSLLASTIETGAGIHSPWHLEYPTPIYPISPASSQEILDYAMQLAANTPLPDVPFESP